MLGALLLAGRSALRFGSGKVYLSFLASNPPVIDLDCPELMYRQVNSEHLFQGATAVLIGPGMGCGAIAEEVLLMGLASPLPLVLDADALNLLAFSKNVQDALSQRPGPLFLTPHPAEAARLLSMTVAEVQMNRELVCRLLAKRYGAHVVLKGKDSLIVEPGEGCPVYRNPTGNPGMATAGMGDVLSGLLVSLLAQGCPSNQSLRAAVFLHGLAADELVLQGVGPIGLTASEVGLQARATRNRLIRETQPGQSV